MVRRFTGTALDRADPGCFPCSRLSTREGRGFYTDGAEADCRTQSLVSNRSLGCFFVFELQAVQFGVQSARLQQFLMPAFLHDFAVIPNVDHVSAADRRTAASAYNYGVVLHQPVQRFKD